MPAVSSAIADSATSSAMTMPAAWSSSTRTPARVITAVRESVARRARLYKHLVQLAPVPEPQLGDVHLRVASAP